ncbi:hypothetical protein LTR10_023751 [Elasticomyces elasticus]|uniref:Uncharacterized protein n=1 Tax=Exophiala sideris TaxID=1016849 RepID=A0ABR0JKV7_9EURO|nr:hypothetical protein LTR10_023751 [Elasticomyces elasticus]KAK5032222.1 hypothetical protein LTR13_007439 [Exophiala sideris]KAK5036220.1 hypothetical protein LTS07_001945 [Exophiala sideris]KAK5066603.1 hypothetical protein LTR69_001949 [Exophiala sideris]KAK5180425.1 hypothetical protein LTR44_007182 [Eurotiomycetes sp. CCFEE 6388]
MPPWQQFIASALSFPIDNTAALVNAKVDFTLFKFEAPAEFAPVGPALTARRRQEAETGPVHRTARRLAALFEDIAPPKPKLVAAYGKRVSNIISLSSINPRGATQHGPFEPFVGADGTAMWAAATSGTGAIEIVMSTLQDINREDLALWDASARSWRRSADQAMANQVQQLELVTKDLNIGFTDGPTLYAKVIAVWNQAMTGMEEFLKGTPQQISDASILLAFSAWHLFPDLIVLEKEPLKISFNDRLFPPNSVGTILLSASDRTLRGVQWSLTLSHLHYYGGAVEVSSLASQPRVKFKRVRLAASGCLFFKWRLNHRDFITAAKVLCGLWETLLGNVERPKDQPATEQFRWLYTFIQASNDLLLAQSQKKVLYEDYMRVVRFGFRRGEEFLGPAEELICPFFGLTNKHVLEALKAAEDLECGIEYLRSVARASGLEPGDAMIHCATWRAFESSGHNPSLYEYVTVCPHQVLAEVGNGDLEPVDISARWLEPKETPTAAEDLQRRKAAISLKGELVITDVSKVEQGDADQLLWNNPPKLFSNSRCSATDTTSHQAHAHAPGCDCLTAKSYQTILFTCQIGSYHCGLYLPRKIDLLDDIRFEPSSALDALHVLRSSAHRGTLWSYMSSLVHES